MNNLFLYVITTLIWGTTWLAIKLQLGTVAPTWSISYRFLMAGVLLLLWCFIRGNNLRYTLREHLCLFLQGVLLFSGNYIFYYLGTQYLVSGVVSVIFALILIMNIINDRIFFKTPITFQIMLGACIGVMGLVRMFWFDFQNLVSNSAVPSEIYFGFVICLFGTLVASLGNMTAKYNHNHRHIPIMQSNAYGMVYGAFFSAVIAVLLGEPATFDFSVQYVSSLAYLTIFGSIIAFGTYLKLMARVGPGRAAYALVMLPLVAMLLSTYFEDFQWTWNTAFGIGFILMGNVLVLSKKNLFATLFQRKIKEENA